MIRSWSDEALSTPSVEPPVQRIADLPVARRRRLADRLGIKHTDAASLVDRLGHPDSALVLLGAISPLARRAARMFVEAVEPLPDAVMPLELSTRLGPKGNDAVEEIEAAGMVVRSKWAGGVEVVVLVPPLSRSLRPYLWMLGDEREPGALAVTDPAHRASAGLEKAWDLAIALAALAAQPPRLPQDGGVHTGDLSRLRAERFSSGLDNVELAARIDTLVEIGLVGGQGARARVDWQRVLTFFDLPPAARLPTLLSAPSDDRGTGAIPPRVRGMVEAGQVRRLLAAGLLQLPAGHWARRKALEAAVRMRILATDALTPYTDVEKAAEAATSHVATASRLLLPCLERYDPGTGDDWVRLPIADEGAADGAWIVQPTHEIIVPPEVPPLGVVRLAQVADLERADVVATFTIGPRSVRRAVGAGLGVDEVVECLTLGAHHALPEALSLQIEGWVRQAAPDLYGGPIDGAGPGEVPLHLRPRAFPLPRPPPLHWPEDVARFREDALRLEEEVNGRGVVR